MAFWPLFLPPTKAKEYQLLSRAWTAKELADMNVINYAVPDFDSLDAKVDELINEMLARPQHALTHTKRLHNKALIAHWNLAQDLSAAYEHLDMLEHNHGNHMDPGWSADLEQVHVREGGWSPDTTAKPAAGS